MSVPTVSVLCAINDQNGDAVSGARIEATLTGMEVYQGHVLPKHTVVTTDAAGAATLELWPNQLGSTESAYAIKIVFGGKTQRLTAVIPNQPTVNLHEVASLPLFPGKLDGQVAIDAAQDAQAAAEAAETQAGAYAASAASSAGSALASAASATASAAAATSDAASALSSKNSATASAATATADAATATAAKDAILAIDPMPKAGGAFSGHITVPAGASGSQAPRASEVGALLFAQKLLGTVSQSAGVPTGSIIERGSNANGEYVRFADGTQICHTNVASTSYANGNTSFTWTYPAAFSPTSHLFVKSETVGTQSSSHKATVESKSGTSATGFIFNTFGSSLSLVLEHIAIGRWF